MTDIKPLTPDFSSKAISTYFRTRFTTLFPKTEDFANKEALLNPFKPLRLLTSRHWNFFLLGIAGWTWDALDFFAVSLNVSSIAESLDVTAKDITWGITLVLMLRSVGAVIFGLWSDRSGRRWPFIVNMVLLIILQIGTGFVKTYKQFLGVRALFGIAMGGVFGNCAACALDDCPKPARGIVGGAFQQGYALGYLLAVVFQRAITDNAPRGWRALFWFSAGVPVLFIIWRYFTPETQTFKAQQNIEKASELTNFRSKAGKTIREQWLIFVYMIILMAGFNFSSHGSQDLYPTLLTKQLHYGSDRSTVTNSVANLGAIFGGIFWGHVSNFIGRRLAIMITCVIGGAMIYPWAYVRNSGINAGVFFLQSCVQGGWGVVPAHISELSSGSAYRSFLTGVSYQLGNLCSSASSTIEATIGERFPIRGADGTLESDVYDYSKVMSIFMGCVFGFLFIVTFLGPELRHANLLTEDIDVDYMANLEDVDEKGVGDEASVISDDVSRRV